MSPTLKSTEVSHFWAKFVEEGVERCKPNLCRYLLPFEHNTRTWQRDRQANRGTATSIPIGEIAFSDVA